MNIKKIILRLLLCFVIIITVVGFCFYEIIKDGEASMKTMNADGITYKDSLPKGYSRILKDVHLRGTIFSKKRKPISIFDVDSQYCIVLYQLPISSNLPLNRIIKEDFSDLNQSTGMYHIIFDDTEFSDKNYPYNIYYKEGPPEANGEIYLTLSGAYTRTIKKTDSLVYYYTQLDDFSIRYTPNGKQDFYGTAKEDSVVDKLPFQLVFLKKNHFIYLIMATAKTAKLSQTNKILSYIGQ